MSYRSVCGAMLYVCLRRYNKTTPKVDDDKWEALTRIASLLQESDIELQHVGGRAVVSSRLSDGTLQPWGVAPLPGGEPLPRGREWSARFLPLLDQALTYAKSRLRRELDLLPRGSLSEDSARLYGAEARALKQGVPSTSLVRRVLWDVAHALACRRKAELCTESAIGRQLVCEAIAALRAACDSDNRVDGDVVSRIVCDEATVDELPTKLMLPQPGYPVDSCYQNWQPPEDTLVAVHPLFIEAPQSFHAPDESLRPLLGHRDSARYPFVEGPHFEPPPADPVVHMVIEERKIEQALHESPRPQPGHDGPDPSVEGSHFEPSPDEPVDSIPHGL